MLTDEHIGTMLYILRTSLCLIIAHFDYLLTCEMSAYRRISRFKAAQYSGSLLISADISMTADVVHFRYSDKCSLRPRFIITRGSHAQRVMLFITPRAAAFRWPLDNDDATREDEDKLYDYCSRRQQPAHTASGHFTTSSSRRELSLSQ